jgi:hypothetical protein
MNGLMKVRIIVWLWFSPVNLRAESEVACAMSNYMAQRHEQKLMSLCWLAGFYLHDARQNYSDFSFQCNSIRGLAGTCAWKASLGVARALGQ